MNQKPIEATCDNCGAVFEVELLKARKGELHAVYLQCPACREIYPTHITDQALRRLYRQIPFGLIPYKQRRSAELRKAHGDSLKRMDGWTEERQ